MVESPDAARLATRRQIELGGQLLYSGRTRGGVPTSCGGATAPHVRGPPPHVGCRRLRVGVPNGGGAGGWEAGLGEGGAGGRGGDGRGVGNEEG